MGKQPELLTPVNEQLAEGEIDPSSDVFDDPEFSPGKIEYREIPGFSGYRVSRTGEVQSCKVVRGNVGGKPGTHRVNGHQWKALKAKPDKTGYMIVHLTNDNGDRFYRKVHQLVLEAFVGPCPDGMECRHFPDRDRANNNLSNLQWGTSSENALDRVADGTQKSKGELHGMAKLTAEKVIEIRKRHENGERTIDLAKEFGVTHQTISKITRRQRWALKGESNGGAANS